VSRLVFQLAHDIAVNWTTNNPTLAAGEVGHETDTNKFKIGNGSVAWASLSYQGGGGSGDMLSTLTNTESVISGASSPAAWDTMYLCSGSSYTVSLPTSLTGLKNKLMGFRMDPGLSGLVTVDAGTGHLIDGVQTRMMWANEVALLKVNTDETNWAKVGGKSIPMASSLGMSGNQTFSAGTVTLLTCLSTNIYNSAPAAMQSAAKFTVLRPGKYLLCVVANLNQCSSDCQAGIYTYKNGVIGLPAIANPHGGGNGYPTANATFPLQLAAGDYLQPYGYFNTGSFATSFIYNDSATPGADNSFSLIEVPTW